MGKQNEWRERVCSIIGGDAAHLHFAGICGVSMSALAEYMLSLGHYITGSDSSPGEMGERLKRRGIPLSGTNSAEYMTGADALIVTSALTSEAPEVVYALAHSIPIFTRAELLGTIMMRHRVRIGVMGTHGKSTTSAMLEHIMRRAGKGYTALVGAPIYDGGGMAEGSEEGLIYEACEYRDAFLSFSPTLAVVTGVELDHTDYFSSLEAVKESFRRAIAPAECLIINSDYPDTEEICEGFCGRIIRYGVDKSADYRYNIIASGKGGTRAHIYLGGECLGEISLPLFGRHNAANATAAIAAAVYQGVRAEAAIAALPSFRGVPQRMEHIGELKGAPIYYDYAHHPTEITAALSALVDSYGGVRVVFRPHTYSRTRDLWWGFVGALSAADEVILTDIYPAREENLSGVQIELLASDIGARARYAPLESLYDTIMSLSESELPLVIMGAGDMRALVNRLKNT